MNRLIVSVLVSLWALPLMGFTLLSGPTEAILPATAEAPEVVFKWNGSTPEIEEKESFKDGQYENLEDKEFMVELLNAAFAVWNEVPGSYLKMVVETDEEIEVDSEDEMYAIEVKGGINLSAAAFAVPSLSDDEGTIIDCDITVADNTVTAEDLAYTLAHEIGHCAGLGHNHTSYKAMMGYSRTDNSLNLGADDKAGLIFLYMHPDYKDEKLEFLGCASLLGGSAKATPWGLLLILFPLVLLGGINAGPRLGRPKL